MQQIKEHEKELANLKNLLRTLHPDAPLQRGYSITYNPHGQLVRSIKAAPAGMMLTTKLADGCVTSTVLENQDK